MAIEPSEDDISTVCDITQADRETARRYLQVKGNDTAKAIGALFDGEDITAQEANLHWDDSAWSADRDGLPVQDQDTSAYNDGNLRPLGASAAPTRGSSPVPSLRRPQTKAEEDEEMERALANSRQDPGFPEQESGVVDAGPRTQFGPATKAQYDPSQWAMTVTAPPDAHEAREIIPDLDVVERGNHGQDPRFLKHLPSGDYVPGLLTIAHSIPAARETLLARAYAVPSYGEDADWWRGHAIKLPKIVSTQDGTPIGPNGGLDDDVVSEMQRLMAFLDASDRSYASVDSLTKLAAIRARQAATHADSVMDTVLSEWTHAALHVVKDQSPIDSLFHTVIGSSHPKGVESPDIWSLPLRISSKERPESGKVTLADIMDNTLWDTDCEGDNLYDNYLESCADVLAVRVIQENAARGKLDMIVPATMHIDKYLKENIASSRTIRQDMAKIKRRIAQTERLQARLAGIQHPYKDEKINGVGLLKSTQEYFSGATHDAVLAEHEARGIDLPPDALKPPPEQAAENLEISQKLDKIWQDIEKKMQLLEDDKVKAREMLTQLSQSTGAGLEGTELRHHYTLCGVSTKPNVTYLLRPKPASDSPPPDAMDTTPGTAEPIVQPPPNAYDEDEDAPPGWMWWRIEYDVSLTNHRIHKTESTTDDVLRAVELEHTSALLVYASDRAMAFRPPSTALPPSLQHFIDADNALYARELLAAQSPHHNWGDAAAGGDPAWIAAAAAVPGPRSRRSSAGSTMVNFDHAEDGRAPGVYTYEEPPAYDGGGRYGYPSVGGKRVGSPEAHEILLDDDEDGGKGG